MVPYGRAHANPPAQVQPAWDSPQTEQLFGRACADCHSNQTQWPWYSNVAPVSWLVQNHVDEGRSKFNVNAPGFGPEAGEAAETVQEGEMPEKTYLPLHPGARLTPAETQALVSGLQKTFGGEAGEGSGD
ncbi:MAG: heme-binding domain-containing protein [Deinococcus sp.]|nr:heme-binding domain-containing protein [Deinococcus sp.]